jgi:DNA-binding response OmpR family regulator
MAKRILVVDDSLTIRKAVVAILERHGYEASSAADGQLALVALTQNPVDLVLVDFMMPNMNGFQFCRALRAKKEWIDLPVVLMSAKSDRIRDQFVRQTGALDAITKPFDAEALVALVENVFRRVALGHLQPHVAPLEESEIPARGSNPPAAEEGGVVISGNLALIPLGAVLQLLQVECQTGVCVVWNPSSEITMTMRRGLVDLVQSRGAGDEFRLGRFFIEEGLVTSKEIDAVLAAGDAPVLGDALVQAGKVSHVQLREALVRQSNELAYEMLRWQKGRFEFRNQAAPPLALRARLGIPVAMLIMEGFRRVDEWRQIEARVGRFDEVLISDATAIGALGEDGLAKVERTVLEAVDGERSIREIVDVTHMSSFDACKILFQLIEARLVRRRDALGPATRRAHGSHG